MLEDFHVSAHTYFLLDADVAAQVTAAEANLTCGSKATTGKGQIEKQVCCAVT